MTVKMTKKEDLRNLDLYKEIVDQNNRVTQELDKISYNNTKIADALDKVVTNIKNLNDENILHHTEVTRGLKTLSDKILYIVIILVVALAIVAGAEKVIQLFGF